jgi:hypothetical protein
MLPKYAFAAATARGSKSHAVASASQKTDLELALISEN